MTREDVEKIITSMNHNTHRYEVLNYLLSGNSLTSIESFYKFGNTRLSATIFDLKNIYGVPIKSEIVHSKAQNGRHIQYSKYFLKF